jgi:hypothetical protein
LDREFGRRGFACGRLANAMGENCRWAAGDFRDEQGGGVVAPELQLAAEFLGHNVNPAFFDLEQAYLAVAKVLCE